MNKFKLYFDRIILNFVNIIFMLRIQIHLQIQINLIIFSVLVFTLLVENTCVRNCMYSVNIVLKKIIFLLHLHLITLIFDCVHIISRTVVGYFKQTKMFLHLVKHC